MTAVFEAAQGEAGGKAGAGGRLADAALAGSHGNNTGSRWFSLGEVVDWNGFYLSASGAMCQLAAVRHRRLAIGGRLAGQVGRHAGLEGAVEAGRGTSSASRLVVKIRAALSPLARPGRDRAAGVERRCCRRRSPRPRH